MAVALVNELVSMAETIDHVFKDASPEARTPDETDALARLINGVSATIQIDVGPVRVQTFTEKFDPGHQRIFTKWRPIVAVTSLTEGIGNSTSLTEDVDFVIYREQGILTRIYGGGVGTWGIPIWVFWSNVPQSIVVTYTAGRSITVEGVPLDLKMAALLWIHDLWTGGPALLSNLVAQDSSASKFMQPTAMPPTVNRILQPYRYPSVGGAV